MDLPLHPIAAMIGGGVVGALGVRSMERAGSALGFVALGGGALAIEAGFFFLVTPDPVSHDEAMRLAALRNTPLGIARRW